MKSAKLGLFLLLFYSFAVGLCYGIEGQTVSPDRKYSVQQKSEGENKTLYLKIESKASSIDLIQIERWAIVKWSDNSKFFAIEDHFDGHMCGLKLYEISEDLKGRVSVDMVYKSPACDYDSYWTLDRFNVEDGTAQIRCKFTFYPDGIVTGPKTDNTYTREYVIPLFSTPKIVAKNKRK